MNLKKTNVIIFQKKRDGLKNIRIFFINQQSINVVPE